MNTPENTKSQIPSQSFEIHIKENLSQEFSGWFVDFTLTLTSNGETILIGAFSDQSALHGLFARIRDLNLTLVSVNPVVPKEKQS